MNQYVSRDPDQMPKAFNTWVKFQDNVLNKYANYEVPVIELTKETPKEAVCTVFENVNTAGVSLNVFELLTATFAADNFRLKDDWKERRAKLQQNSITAEVANTDFCKW